MSAPTPPRQVPPWTRHWPLLVCGALVLGLVVIALVLAFA